MSHQWQEHAKRVGVKLGINTKDNNQWFAFFKRAYEGGKPWMLEVATTYCVDAERVEDLEKLFYWRFHQGKEIKQYEI